MKKLIISLGLLFATNIFANENKVCPSYYDFIESPKISQSELEKFERNIIYSGESQKYNAYLWILKAIMMQEKKENIDNFINPKIYKMVKEKGSIKDMTIIMNKIDVARAKFMEKDENERKSFKNTTNGLIDKLTERISIMKFSNNDWCDRNLLK